MNKNLMKVYNRLNNSNVLIYDFKDENNFKAVSMEYQGKFAIFTNSDTIENQEDEFCVMAHEYGHCKTGAMHKVNSPYELIEKHEHKANRKAIIDFLPFRLLQKAFAANCTEIWQIADFFDLPYKFVEMSLNYYKDIGKFIS